MMPPRLPMYGTEFRECLEAIGMTQRGLGAFLSTSRRSPARWARDRTNIPQELADWLRWARDVMQAHPRPTYGEWAMRGDVHSTERHAAMFDCTRHLGWSLEEFSRELGIEAPVWDTTDTVRGGAPLVLTMLAAHGWHLSGIATRVLMADEDHDGPTDGPAVVVLAGNDAHFAVNEGWTALRTAHNEAVTPAVERKIGLVEDVLQGVAELPRAVADWIVQRDAFHCLTRGNAPVSDTLLAWLRAVVRVRTSFPEGWKNGAGEPVIAEVSCLGASTIDPLTGAYIGRRCPGRGALAGDPETVRH